MKFNILLIISVISLLAVVPLGQEVFGYGAAPVQSSSNNFTVDIQTDKESYALGEHVAFSGNVNKYDEDRSLRISIFDSKNNLVVTQKTPVNSDTTFSHDVSLNEKFSDGKYVIKTQYGNSKATIDITSFMITSDSGTSMTSDNAKIPDWIKSNAGWWAEGQIDDRSFVEGIQFMIKEGLMKIPVTEQGSSSKENNIPDWIKSNAGWWAEGQIDDRSFVEGIQFMIKEGLMNISS